LFKNGETVVSEDAQPVYIRNDVAKKSQKQKFL
jgi:tRNA A37 threonylcarbamoyladenosine modification protein TsaB